MTKRIKRKKLAPGSDRSAMVEAFNAARTAPAAELAAIPPTPEERIASLEKQVASLGAALGDFFPKIATWGESVDADRKVLFENDRRLLDGLTNHWHPGIRF